MKLVTGGTGLTGSHLLFELTRSGEKIRATRRDGSSIDFIKQIFSLYNPNPESQLSLIEWVAADLLDYASLLDATAGVDTVFHTGAVVSFNPRRSASIIETNVTGTANIVNACLTNGVKNFCHVSSIASLGEPNNRGVVDEGCYWTKSKGVRAYTKSKFLGEMEVWRGAEQGLRVVIVNPSVIIGPCKWESGSGQLIGRVAKGMPFYTEGVTGYVDVRDVAKAMILLMADDSICNQRFVLNSQNLSFRELFTLIAQSTGSKPPKHRISPRIINLVWPIANIFVVLLGLGSSVTKNTIQSAFNKTYYSSEKIKARLGFTFIPIAESISFVGDVYKKEQGILPNE